MDVDDVTVEVDGAVLAGSMWTPAQPRAALLMLPGSGPSTRDNDIYFPAIREHLLVAGFAVASFDKRGVGESTGSLLDTSIERQTDDALACLAALRGRTGGLRWGVFGHSQGGWVVFEVAARDDTLFAAVANSGPAVGVAEQERFRVVGSEHDAATSELRRRFDDAVRTAAAGADHADVMALVDGWPELVAEFADLAEAWPLAGVLYRYDPEGALRRIRVPTLCLYGSRDRVVPVTACLAVLDRVANPDLDVAVIAGGDHRAQLDTGEFAPAYVGTLVGFLTARC